MPIKPESKKRYPRNWRAIRVAILERSSGFCEGTPIYPDCRAQNGMPHPITGSRVILTIAHLDHVPEHCNPSNLRALCQRCHLTYDSAHRGRANQGLDSEITKYVDAINPKRGFVR